jgi:hypothetical protein
MKTKNLLARQKKICKDMLLLLQQKRGQKIQKFVRHLKHIYHDIK